MTNKRQAQKDQARCGAVAMFGGILGLALMSTSASADIAVLERSRLTSPPPLDGVQMVQAERDPASRAREQAIIGRLEEEIRRLTGRIEQLEFDQRNTNQRMDQLIQDLDQRFRALESGEAGALTGADAGAEGAPSDEAGAADGERTRAQQALEQLATPSGDGELGSVPESALSDLPKPDPATVAAPDRNTLTAEQQYEKAVQLLQAGDYQGAQGGLETFLDIHEGHQLASNAAYWLAETHYVRKNYSASAAAFARNYRAYGKESSKAVDNLLKLGMSLSNLGEEDKACLTYDELTSSFPNRPAHIQQALSRERARAECS